MIISGFFWVNSINIWATFTPSHNVHDIHSDYLSGLRSNSKWWSRPPYPHVYSHINQGWWNSVGCLLHTGGGHCWDLHLVRHTPPKVCFGIQWSNWLCYFILHMKCKLWCVGSSKQWLCMKRPLKLGLLLLLPSMWGPTWWWWMGNLLAPNLWPQIGRRNPNYPLVTLTQVGWPTSIANKPWGWWTPTAHGGPPLT